jgi:hypothetical protein
MISKLLAINIIALVAIAEAQTSQRGEERITREVRHELVMLSYYDVFDNLTYRVDGSKVTLSGQVTRPTLKSDAENVVKKIEGVESVGQPNRGSPALTQRRPHPLGRLPRHLFESTPSALLVGRGAANPYRRQEWEHHAGRSCRQRRRQEYRRDRRQGSTWGIRR